MRSAVGVALVTVCLGLAGCSLFGKKQTAQNTNSKPFLGSSSPAKTETVSVPRDSDGPLPGANGLLAGQVVAVDTGKPVKAFIQVKNLEQNEAKVAELDVGTDEAGYFTIPSLKVGGHYELIARANEGSDVISQRVFVQPPKANLLLRLDKRFTTSTTPKVPDAPSMPSKKKSSTENSSDRTSAVIVEPPVKLPANEQPSGGMETNPASDNGSGASSGSGNPPNPANIAQDFRRIPPSQPATIPNPPPLPSNSQWDNVPDSRQPQPPPAVPRPPGAVRIPTMPTRVPSCVVYGNRLDNLALYDLDGKVWEYSRDRRGRLLLLDFWYHSCPSCLHGIPNLVVLQKDFQPFGLEVVSIACERGTLDEQRQHVRTIRARYQINYLTLLSGGGPDRCPTVKQFQVEYYPTLVLIDSDGNILWRSPREGMDDLAHERLRRLIESKLVSR